MTEEAAGSFIVNVNHVYRTLSTNSVSAGLLTAYLVISLVMAIGCGLLLVFLVCTREQLQMPRHYLRCNLAVDDIFFTCYMIPVEICWIFSQDANNDQLLCWLQLLFIPPFTMSTFGTYLMMASELYYFICRPLHYHDKVTTKRVIIGIFVVRSFAGLFGLVPAVIRRVENADGNLLCHPEEITSTTTAAIFMGIFQAGTALAVVVIFVLYVLVFREARKQQQKDENRKLWLYQTKAFKTIAPHVIVLAVSGITAVFMFVMIRVFSQKATKASSFVLVIVYAAKVLYLTASPMVNPIVYSFRQPEFRRALRQLCGFRINVPVAPAPPRVQRQQRVEQQIDVFTVPVSIQKESDQCLFEPS